MFNSWIQKIKNWGVGAAIDALDAAEGPLGDRIQGSIDEFRKLDGHGVAILLVDEIQSFLREFFKLPAKPKAPSSVLKL